MGQPRVQQMKVAAQNSLLRGSLPPAFCLRSALRSWLLWHRLYAAQGSTGNAPGCCRSPAVEVAAGRGSDSGSMAAGPAEGAPVTGSHAHTVVAAAPHIGEGALLDTAVAGTAADAAQAAAVDTAQLCEASQSTAPSQDKGNLALRPTC